MLAGGIVNIVLNTIAEGTYPNYSLRTNALSDPGGAESTYRSPSVQICLPAPADSRTSAQYLIFSFSRLGSQILSLY